MKQRPLIERIIFNLTHFFGARYARSTGLPKANFQVLMATAAFSLRQLIRLQFAQATRSGCGWLSRPRPESV